MKETRKDHNLATFCSLVVILLLLLHPCIALSSLKTPKELQSLAHKSTLRKRGSKNFQKAWRNWLHLSVDSIRNELNRNLPDPVDENELEDLSFSLGVAADIGEMPSGFSNSGARSGYALDYFCWARLLADFFIDTDNPTLPMFWQDVFDNHSFLQNGAEHVNGQNGAERADGRVCNLTSIGGGPGFDFVGAALVSTFNAGGEYEKISPIQATILDYESGWSNLVEAMNEATNNVLQTEKKTTCTWGGVCDVTKPLNHPSNADCLAKADSTSIWTCQYCVAENAIALRDSDYIFFRNLFEAVPNDTLFIFSETTPRLWPEFYALLVDECETNQSMSLQIGFPYKRGPLMVIQKTSSERTDLPIINKRDMKALQDFKKYAERHEQLMETGWERQKSKKFFRRTSTT